MSDTYGSGLSFTPDAPPGGAAPDAPMDITPPGGAAPTAPQQSFGSSLRGMLPGPNYTPPDPQASALDQASNLLEQRVKRAGAVATNPLAQIFAPEQAQAAREFIPKAAEDLQKIKGQQQHAVDIKNSARNWGLTNPNQFGEAATDTTLANEALRQWKDEGNFNAYKALSGLSPEWKNRADLYTPDAMSKFGDHVTAVQDGIKTLNGAASVNSEQAFAAARAKVVKDNDLGALGIKESSIPKTINEWLEKRGSLEAQYNMARRTLNAFNARQDQLNQAVPVHEEKVAKQIEGTFQFGNGEAIPGFKAVGLPGYGDVQGVMGPPGSRDTANRGVTWSNAAPEQIKTVREQLGAEEVKGALSKYKIAREFNSTVNNKELFKSAAGLALISDELGAIGRDVAEGSKAAGTVGLTKMLEAKYGTIDKARNRLKQEKAAFDEWRGKPASERSSMPSIEGVKEVARFKHEQALQEARDRVSQPLETAGRYGMVLKNLGLDKELIDSPELRTTYDAALRQGNKELDSYPMVTIGDRRVLLPSGSNVPGAKVAPLDHSAPPTPNPGQQPTTGSAQQPGPSAPNVGPNGGPGQPVTIAGQQVTLPRGISPEYVQSLQRIESGNERDPWKAGTKLSSASGAFQFIKSTWAADKPPGAPDRAADATPQEQTQALANRAQKDTASLKTLNLPVTDTNLYVMHNLGAGGGATLLQASPDADARSVVGEAAARNNPLFFKGRPTVATVLQRYADEMSRPPAGETQPGAGGGQNFNARMRSGREAMRSGAPGPNLSGERNTGAQLRDKWADVAPAVGSTVGAIGGGLSPLPFGTAIGGGVGGAAGQVVKDYLKGQPQNPREIAKQGALGVALGVAPAGRPVVGAALRAGGVGAIEAADAATKGEDVDPLEAGVKGAAYALGGEALGRFVSSAGHAAYKNLSRYTIPAQRDLSVQAGKLSEARQVLESEKPKLPGADGKEMPNPKYEAAKKQADEAEASIKDHNQNPDDMVHAYEQAKAGVSSGEAAVMRKAASEKAATSEGYNQLRQDARETGVGTPKANQNGQNILPSGLRFSEGPSKGPNADPRAHEIKIVDANGASQYRMEITQESNGLWGVGHVENVSRDHAGLAPQVYQQAAQYAADRGGRLVAGMNTNALSDRVLSSMRASGIATPVKVGERTLLEIKPPSSALKNGPLTQLRTADNMAGKVPEQFRPEAEHAEMLIKAPAKDWGEKWQQLQNAGTELIEKRMAFLANNDKPSAKAMDDLFAGVRTQQKAAAEYVFGKKGGAEVIAKLESLDKSWAKIMGATQGMDYGKMQSVLASGNTPQRRELEKNFREFAKGDPSAIRAFNAMKAGARGDWKTEAALMTPIIASEVTGVLPTFGVVTALVGGHRLYKLMQGYMNAKTLGTAVTFKDFLASQLKPNRTSGVAGQTGARAATQSGDLPGDAGAALNAAIP